MTVRAAPKNVSSGTDVHDIRFATLHCMTTRREGAAPAALGRLAAALGVAAAIGLAGVALDAQPALKPLSIDAIYDPLTRANFSGAVPQASWLDDTTYLLRRPGATWQKVNALVWRHGAALRRGRDGVGARGAARRVAVRRLRGVAGSARVQRDLHARPGRTLAGDLYVFDFVSRPRRASDRAGRRRGGSVLQPRRTARRLRAQPQPVHRGRGVGARARAHDRWQRPAVQRQARLALSGRDLRPRQLQRLLVEPRLVAASRSCSSTSGRCPSTPSPITSPTAPRSR